MENVLLRKTKMFDKVDFVANKYENIWGANVPFKENVIAFRSLREKITEKSHEQTDSSSASSEKKMALKKMLDLTLLLCNAGMAYGSTLKNFKLKTEFNFSLSDLKKGNETEICNRCLQIANSAIPVIDKLMPYSLPANHIDLLKNSVKAFEKLISSPGEVRNSSKSAKEEMLVLIKECIELLKERLDKQMLFYKETHPDFYTEYFNARYIGGWHKKKDDGNGDDNLV